MRQLLDLAGRFRGDERGAFAVIFALMAIVLVAMAGAAVDFTSMQQARTKAQVALDSAALALQPTIYTSSAATIQSQVQPLVIDRLADPTTSWVDCSKSTQLPCITVNTPVIDTVAGSLTLTATMKVPMDFVDLVGIKQLQAQILSVATRQKLNLEVAMVLDNSGSMDFTMGYNANYGGTSRMDTLKSSATCATNILFYGVSSCTASTNGLTANANVKIGLVPFTQEVNVGTANATASWLDTTGASAITREHFDNDDDPSTAFTGTVQRLNLFKQIKDSSNNTLSWGGCVEARTNNGSSEQFDTDDTTPTSSNPDTLFTPYFAPDEPGTATSYNSYSSNSGYYTSTNGEGYYDSYIADTSSSCSWAAPTCVQTYTKSNCSSSSYNSCGNSASLTSITQTVRGVVTHPSTCRSDINDLVSTGSNPTTTATKSGSRYTDTASYTYTSNQVLQERLCKYNNVKMADSPSLSNVFGPNGDCPAAAIQPLTNSPATVTNAINAMVANGGTNITEGAAWGFRVLSPTAPFTEGNAYDNSTSKVLIVMTDGENTIYPGVNMNDANYYSAYGYPTDSYPTDGRLGVVSNDSGTLEAVMNTRLSTVCTNAKAKNITIYTIGVDVADTTNPTASKQLLTNCATNSGDAYFPNTASDLTSAFEDIANQLAALRLSK